jgi:adenylate kinase family enzyme
MDIGNRISIIGTSCSGKTTLGKLLANRFGLSFMDYDDAYWLSGWLKADRSVFESKIKDAACGDHWVLAGNSPSDSQRLVWPKVDTIIWLDLPLSLLLWRGIRRSIGNIFFRRPLCNGNYETLGRLFSKNSIIYWIWSSSRRRRKVYSNLFSTRPFPCRYIHLKSSKELQLFLKTIFY